MHSGRSYIFSGYRRIVMHCGQVAGTMLIEKLKDLPECIATDFITHRIKLCTLTCTENIILYLGCQYNSLIKQKKLHGKIRCGPTSLILISASTYCKPFCIMEMSAAGGTRAPFMLDWLMWLSIPNVNAECEKPVKKKLKSKIFT